MTTGSGEGRPIRWPRALALLCTGAALAWLAGGCSNGEAQAEEVGGAGSGAVLPTVEVVEAERGGLTNFSSFTGEVWADRIVDVSSREAGEIIELLVDEGERVEAGQVMARLDGEVQERRQAEARAAEQTARARVAEAQAALDRERAELQRRQRLVDRNALPAAEVDALQDELEVLRTRFELAEVQVAEARTLAASRRAEVDRRVVRAPFAGRVVTRHVSTGAVVSAQTPLFTLVDEDSLEFRAMLSERRIASLEPGRRAEVRLDASPDDLVRARVRRVGNRVEPESRTIEVRFGLDGATMPIRHGMFGRGLLALESVEDAILVPEIALEERPGGVQRVWRVVEGALEVHEVDVLLRAGERAAIRGIEAGDMVVVSPVTRLAEGDEVRTRRASVRGGGRSL